MLDWLGRLAVRRLGAESGVLQADSYWTLGGAAALRSDDRRSALVDTRQAIGDRLPLALGIVAAAVGLLPERVGEPGKLEGVELTSAELDPGDRWSAESQPLSEFPLGESGPFAGCRYARPNVSPAVQPRTGHGEIPP